MSSLLSYNVFRPAILNMEVQPRPRVKVNEEFYPPVVARLRVPVNKNISYIFASISLVDMENTEHKYIVGRDSANAVQLDVAAASTNVCESHQAMFFVFPSIKVREEGKFRFIISAFYVGSDRVEKIVSKATSSFEVDQDGETSVTLSPTTEKYIEELEKAEII